MPYKPIKTQKSKEAKAELLRFINEIKEQFKESVSNRDPRRKQLSKLRGERMLLDMNVDMFGNKKLTNKDLKAQKTKLEAAIDKIESQITDIEDNNNYKGSFEWRFEFPEVLDDKGDFVGFDVIIGNPPYFSLSKETASSNLKKQYDTFSNSGDIYALFYELGAKILKQNALLCFITGSAWLRASYGKLLRDFFSQKTNPLLLIDFSDCQIFDEATILTTIMQFQKTENKNILKSVRFGRELQKELERLKIYVDKNSVILNDLNNDNWSIVSAEVQSLKLKVENQGVKLKDWDISINRGLLTGFNEAFIIDEVTKSQLILLDKNNIKIIKPLLRGRDIGKYHYNFAKLYLIATHNGDIIKSEFSIEYKEENNEKFIKTAEEKNWQKIDRIEWKNKSKTQVRVNRIIVEEDHPSIFEFLSKYKNQLEQRLDKGEHWTNLRNCTYWTDFEKKKVIYAELTKFFNFSLDNNNVFIDKTAFILVGEQLEYLTCFLNSKLFKYCFENNFSEIQGHTRVLSKIFFEEIPVKKITFEQNLLFVSKTEQILALKKENPAIDTTQLEAEIDAMVYELYDLTPEEIAIVEGK